MSQKPLVPDIDEDCLGASRILVLAVDLPDAVFGCGGAIIKCTSRATPVGIVIALSGSLGEPFGSQRGDRDLLAAREAAVILGYDHFEALGLRREEVLYNEAIIGRIDEKINRLGADVVFAPSLEESDPHRRALGMAAVETMRRSGRGSLVLYEVDVAMVRPDRTVDITAVIKDKRRAMACFDNMSEGRSRAEEIHAPNRSRAETPNSPEIFVEAQRVLKASFLAKDFLDLYVSEHRSQRSMGLGITPDDSPLVSVLMRSMNRDTILEALDSIALQTYPNIEVIVANACGIGHRPLPEWCGRFPLRFLDGKQPLRRSVAANRLLLAACGQWLMFLDDDDWVDPDHIASLRIALTPEDIAAYSSVRCVDDNRMILVQRYDHPWDPVLLRAGNYLPIHAVLFSRCAVEQDCRFDETLDIFEDWDFWLQVARLGSYRHTERFSASYRIHAGAGWGVSFDEIEARRVTATVLRKWQKRWSDEELIDFVDRLRQLDRECSQMTKICDELRATIAHWESEAFLRGDLASKLDQELAASYRLVESRTLELVEARSHWQAAQDELRNRTSSDPPLKTAD